MDVRSRALLFTALACAASLCSACESPTFPADATEFTPPISYRLDWRIVEYCSGLQRDYGAVRWYRTPGSAVNEPGGAAGAYFRDGNRVVLNEGYLEEHEVVRHEMLHALQPRIRMHLANFMNDCRGLVSCDPYCVAEAGGSGIQPGMTSPVVPPESLEVVTTVLPREPGDSTLFAVIISARNPSSSPVWVDLTTVPRLQFICRIGMFSCGRLLIYPSDSAAFAPGERRSEASLTSVLSGTFSVNGFFNSKAAAPVSVTIP